jgi:hypothetical protein
MKKIILSSLAALTISSVVSANQTPLSAKASKLNLSGNIYLSSIYNKLDNAPSTAKFDIRRAYLQLKSYFLNDPKSYYRLTLDLHNDNGSKNMRIKYAYAYLANILPSTGVEIGVAHRPWHDYETHHSWFFRAIAKVPLAYKNTANLSSSADLGVNFKTKTRYFDSEIGLYNGEGYSKDQASDKGMSFEWRTTAHILGVNGSKQQTKKTYLDVSFFGQYNSEHSNKEDLIFGGLHTVYNMPSFLISAQYIYSKDTLSSSAVSSKAGSGYSANAEYRIGSKKEYRFLARYDSWTKKSDDSKNKAIILGTAWKQSSNMDWLANVTITDNDKTSSRYNKNGTSFMLTANVKF